MSRAKGAFKARVRHRVREISMTPKIAVLMTGGTIGHRSRPQGGAVMDFDPAQLRAEIGISDVELTFRELFKKGSMDIVPQDWVSIAAGVHEMLRCGATGVVILHGTDTMQYTAAALSFMLEGLGKPVILTGSMRPGGDGDSDALPNLRDAVRVAAGADLAEVCIVFSADRERSRAAIIRGNRARKIHSHAIDAFASINAPAIGVVEADEVRLGAGGYRRRNDSTPTLALKLEENVVLVKLTPAVTPGSLARCLKGAAGAVLEGTGVGHMRSDLNAIVAEFGKPTIMSTQAVYGGERLGGYAVDQQILAIPHVIPGADMTSETALVKLMWALGQGGDIRSLMLANLAGEIEAPPPAA
jgi:L-asparaginase type I